MKAGLVLMISPHPGGRLPQRTSAGPLIQRLFSRYNHVNNISMAFSKSLPNGF